MDVIVLAGGYATRLYPLTLDLPKPLLCINDIPIVNHILKKVENLPDINNIYVITNDKFHSHFQNWQSSYDGKFKLIIVNDGTTSNEDRLGTVGDINFVIKKYDLRNNLLVVAGDNLFEDELIDLLDHFSQNGSSILVNDVGDLDLAKLYGIVSVDGSSKITSFVEKPEQPDSTLASTCIYAFKAEHLPLLQKAIDEGFSDRAGDFIKFLSERKDVFAFPLRGKWFDVGTTKQLEEAERHFKK